MNKPWCCLRCGKDLTWDDLHAVERVKKIKPIPGYWCEECLFESHRDALDKLAEEKRIES